MTNWLKRCRIQSRVSDDFPFCLPLLNNDIELEFNTPITLICGENGSGKSTILESLAVNAGFSVYGGGSSHVLTEVHIPKVENYNGYTFFEGLAEKQTVSPDNTALADSMQLTWSVRTKKGFFLRAEHLSDSVVNTVIRDGIQASSHGEGLMGFVEHYCCGDGLYIFDEPETALSPAKQLELLVHIVEQTKACRAQYIIATHSPILMAIPECTLYYIQNNELSKCDYKDTLHFQLYKRFILNPDEFIKKLL